MVAAFFPLFLVPEQELFRGEIELAVFQREAADVLAGEVGRGVLEVDPVVAGEVRIEGEADEAVLLGGGDRDFADQFRFGLAGPRARSLPSSSM